MEWGAPAPQPLEALYTPGVVERVAVCGGGGGGTGTGDMATELGSLLSPVCTHDNIVKLLGVCRFVRKLRCCHGGLATWQG